MVSVVALPATPAKALPLAAAVVLQDFVGALAPIVVQDVRQPLAHAQVCQQMELVEALMDGRAVVHRLETVVVLRGIVGAPLPIVALDVRRHLELALSHQTELAEVLMDIFAVAHHLVIAVAPQDIVETPVPIVAVDVSRHLELAVAVPRLMELVEVQMDILVVVHRLETVVVLRGIVGAPLPIVALDVKRHSVHALKDLGN
jgi:hypothetical protein